MKKSVIVTLTLSLVLMMAGCSAETIAENPQNKWGVIVKKFSDISENLTSSVTVECNASDLTPEQIQEFTEETIRTRVFYMNSPVAYVQEPQEQSVADVEETNDKMGVFLKITSQEPTTAENTVDNVEDIDDTMTDSKTQIENTDLTEETEAVIEEPQSLKTQTSEKPVIQAESQTENKADKEPESDIVKESEVKKQEPVVEEIEPVNKQELVVEDVKIEPAVEIEEEVEETKPQENDSIDVTPSDSTIDIKSTESTEAAKLDETVEPEEIEKPTELEIEPEIQEEPPEPSVNFVDADEYYYVSASALNFREGPDTSYDVITTLSTNTKVHVIGKGDNGWNKIDLNGRVCYASASYLSKNKIVIKEPEPVQSKPKESVQDEMARRGSLGRLSIGSCGVNVALFSANLNNLSAGQAIVDRNDSAAYYTDTIDYWGYVLVADHVHQGFSGIKQSIVGSTIATFDFGSYQKTAICVDRFIGYNGYNGAGGLFTTSGAEIGDRGDICMYTCNSDGTVTITFWNYC